MVGKEQTFDIDNTLLKLYWSSSKYYVKYQQVINEDEESIYNQFYDDKKFLEILNKYNIKINFQFR